MLLHIPQNLENNRLDGFVMFPRESEWQTAIPNQCTIGGYNRKSETQCAEFQLISSFPRILRAISASNCEDN